MTKPDRPSPASQLRAYKVRLRDGKEIILHAYHRAMARHYSKSFRDDYVSSKDHYRDVVSVRIIAGYCEDLPF